MDKEQTLKYIINETLWMAARYAHGRHTFAPNIVREAVAFMKNLYPDWEMKPDPTIKPPAPEDIQGMSFREDFLDDLFPNNLARLYPITRHNRLPQLSALVVSSGF